nr:hypothetical protein [Desulfobacula sp.]
MKKTSLKFKLIVGGILAAIIPLTVVGVFSITRSSSAWSPLPRDRPFRLHRILPP